MFINQIMSCMSDTEAEKLSSQDIDKLVKELNEDIYDDTAKNDNSPKKETLASMSSINKNNNTDSNQTGAESNQDDATLLLTANTQNNNIAEIKEDEAEEMETTPITQINTTPTTTSTHLKVPAPSHITTTRARTGSTSKLAHSSRNAVNPLRRRSTFDFRAITNSTYLRGFGLDMTSIDASRQITIATDTSEAACDTINYGGGANIITSENAMDAQDKIETGYEQQHINLFQRFGRALTHAPDQMDAVERRSRGESAIDAITMQRFQSIQVITDAIDDGCKKKEDFLTKSKIIINRDELPDYYIGYSNILTGYRYNYNFCQATMSLFTVHNETGNIWTEIIPTLGLLALCM